MNYYSENIGKVVKGNRPLHSILGVVRGDTYLYTTLSGIPAVFNVVNLTKDILVASFELEFEKNCWIHTMDSKGNVYLGIEATIYQYNPYENSFMKIGRCHPDEATNFTMCMGEKDEIYIGTYPNARVMAYDTIKKEFSEIIRIENYQYVRAITYCNGYVYGGAFGNDHYLFFRVNPQVPGSFEEIPVPMITTDYANINWLYTANTVRDYVFLYTRGNKKDLLLIFDTKTMKFIDHGFNGNFESLYVSEEINEMVYFQADQEIYSLNLNTFRFSPLKIKSNLDYLYGPMIINENLAALDTKTGNLIVFDKEVGQRIEKPLPYLQGGSLQIHGIEKGPDPETIYLSAYLAHNGAIYNTTSKETKSLILEQAEGMIAHSQKQYFGIYPKARIFVYDPKTDEIPTELVRLGHFQDRPFAMAKTEDKLIIGTIADYGKTQGALSIFDQNSGELKVFDHIVKNQSITSICCKVNILYGATTVTGGLGCVITEQEPKIFSFDLESETKLDEFYPPLTTVSSPNCITSVSLDPYGRLWGTCGYTLFCLNPETKELIYEIKFADFDFSKYPFIWRPLYIRWKNESLFYVNIDGIKGVNIDTMEITDYKDATGSVFCFELGTDGNLYYANDEDRAMFRRLVLLG